MNFRTCALAFLVALAQAMPATAATTPAQESEAFAQATTAFADTFAKSPGIEAAAYRQIRHLVFTYPDICNRQDDGGATLLMHAAIADATARFQHAFSPAVNVGQASMTFMAVLRATSDAYLYATDRSGRCALDYACGSVNDVHDMHDMDELYMRYKRAHRTPNLNQVLLNVVQGSRYPSLLTVRWLMAAGANPRTQDNQGYTIVQRAQQEQEPAVVDALEGR